MAIKEFLQKHPQYTIIDTVEAIEKSSGRDLSALVSLSGLYRSSAHILLRIERVMGKVMKRYFVPMPRKIQRHGETFKMEGRIIKL